MRRTLLIIHPGALGDLLLAVPAMRALRAAFPHHRIGLIAQGEAASLMLACAEVHKSFAIEGEALASLLAGTETIDTGVEQWLLGCEVAVVWMADPHRSLESVLRKFGVPRILLASPHSSVYRSVHQTDRFLETVKPVVSTSSDSHPLQLPDTVIAQAGTRLVAHGMSAAPPIVMIHPGSGSPYKCVAPGVLTDLIRWYQTNAIVPLVVSGPADVEQVDALHRRCSEPFPLLKNLTLLQIAGVIRHAALFIGHDSGLTHLAACLHVPTIALFGPTDPNRWAPRGVHVKVVTGASCRCQGWQAVRACPDKPCLQITLEQIISACATCAGVG